MALRIRKNAANLTSLERSNLKRAILALRNEREAGKMSTFEEFAALHLAVGNLDLKGSDQTIDWAHSGGALLPWHRAFLELFENDLRKHVPDVTLPYWNWGSAAARDSEQIFTQDYFGTLATTETNPTKIFDLASLSYENRFFENDISQRSPIYRDGNNLTALTNWATSEQIQRTVGNAINSATYNDFLASMDGLHGVGHGVIGGQMGTYASPLDPIFFLHHCQLDHIWAQWQHFSDNRTEYSSTNPLRARNENMWPWDGWNHQATNPSKFTVNWQFASDLPTFNYRRTPGEVLLTANLGYVYDTEFNKSQVYGSESGYYRGQRPVKFDGLEDAAKHYTSIDRLIVRHGNILDGIEVRWEGSTKTEKYGNSMPDRGTTWDVPNGEVITELELEYGQWFGAVQITKAKFKTNAGTESETFGDGMYATRTNRVTLKKEGHQITGFTGASVPLDYNVASSNKVISALGVIFSPM